MDASDIKVVVENAEKLKHLLQFNAFVRDVIKQYEWTCGSEADSTLHACNESPLIAKKISSLRSILNRLEICFWALFFPVNGCIIITTNRAVKGLIVLILIDIALVYIHTIVNGKIIDRINAYEARLKTLNRLYESVEKLLTQWDPQTLTTPDDVSRNLHSVAQAIMVLEGSENPEGNITVIWDSDREKQIPLKNMGVHVRLREMVDVAFTLKLIPTPKYDVLFKEKPKVIDFCI